MSSPQDKTAAARRREKAATTQRAAEAQVDPAPELSPLGRTYPTPLNQARSAVELVTVEPLPESSSAATDEFDPATVTEGEFARGGASWYGLRFNNRRTASGEKFDISAMTAAHRTLPFGTEVCVRSLVNGRSVKVRVNDRGPHAPGRIIDLSRAAAEVLGMVGLGIKQVALSLPTSDGQDCGKQEP